MTVKGKKNRNNNNISVKLKGKKIAQIKTKFILKNTIYCMKMNKMRITKTWKLRLLIYDKQEWHYNLHLYNY